MSRRLNFEVEVPDDVCVHLPQEEFAAKAKEALVMELLREHQISQGKAAEMLGILRHDLFDLMTRYQVSVLDLTHEELKVELQKPFPRSS